MTAAARAVDRSVLTETRRRVIRAGLIATWALLALFVAVAVAEGALDRPRVSGALGLLTAALVGLTVAPWDDWLGSWRADGAILVWALGLILGLVAAGGVRDAAPLVGAFAAVIVFCAAAMLAPEFLLTASIITVIGYLVALLDATESLDPGEAALRLAVLGAVAVLTASLSLSLRGHLRATDTQVELLREREAGLRQREFDLTHLYAVSRTLSAGTDIEEVVPELVGRVARAVGARVGLVLFYSEREQELEVLSPIWVAGHAVRAEGYRLLMSERGLGQRVFMSGESIVADDPDDFRGDPLLEDLAAENAAAVPLRLEVHTIGVLIVTDKRDGGFSHEDLSLLASMATPAALVLNHLARYREEKETSVRLAELARLKSDFVSVVSHELRTPLTSIIGSLATLSRPEFAPGDPNARALLDSARRQSNRLKSLIEDLLMASRLDNRALPVRPESIHLDRFVAEAVEAVPGAEEVASVHLAPGLPVIEADPDHLARIITNLVDNAMKYAPDSPIEVIVRSSGSEVWISVVDHGPGIPFELHEHVFERFTQVDGAATRSRSGTGLGLSIVRGLAEAMGGRVWFEPTVGGGATFSVALPGTASAYDLAGIGG